MITAELQGKLGNMMFQIAFLECAGHLYNLETCYPHVNANIEALKKPQACTSEPHGEKYFTFFKNFDWHKNLGGNIRIDRTINVPFEYVPIEPIDYTRYIGYFQSEKYFPNRNFILNLFEPAEFIQDRLKKYKDIIGENKASIHVRRGDYIKLNHIYNVLDMDYYTTAMKCLRMIGVDGYLVFSTDKEWCKENFKGSQFTFIDDDSIVELFLMSKCDHHIAGNSAFSWWGCWLGDNPEKQVIAPKKWFTAKTPNGKDIIPESWITI